MEARNRKGGRINSITLPSGTIIDAGASWIHGIGPGAVDLKAWKGKYNPIYEIAKANNIQTVRTWKNED